MSNQLDPRPTYTRHHHGGCMRPHNSPNPVRDGSIFHGVVEDTLAQRLPPCKAFPCGWSPFCLHLVLTVVECWVHSERPYSSTSHRGRVPFGAVSAYLRGAASGTIRLPRDVPRGRVDIGPTWTKMHPRKRKVCEVDGPDPMMGGVFPHPGPVCLLPTHWVSTQAVAREGPEHE